MWSNKYYNLNIYKNEALTDYVETAKLRAFLNSVIQFKQISKYAYKNNEDFPFLNLLLLKAKSLDNWDNSDCNSRKTNLIAIVIRKDMDTKFEKIKIPFIKVASFLNWKLVDEQTDDGKESFIIWKPS